MIKCEDYTILIVDDEEDIREIIAEFLEDEGFNVLTASGGKEAYELTQTNNIQLIVSDINMPEGNGVELLTSVKHKNPEKPVLLFITGFADVTTEEAYDRGAEAVFSKPVDYEKLIHKIKECLLPKVDFWSNNLKSENISSIINLTFDSFESAIKNKDIIFGRGGMYIKQDSNLPIKDEIINFLIEFKDGELMKIEGQGIVKWIRHNNEKNNQPGIGIEFTYFTSDTKDKYIDFLNNLNTKVYIPLG